MKTCDFSRSFVTFVTPGRANNARIQVEALCQIEEIKSGAQVTYYLIASCKGEDTYGKGVLFLDPNYDFCAIFSQKEFMIIRVGAPYKPANTIGDNKERFHHVLFDIKMTDGELLESGAAIVEATLVGRVLNGRTEITDQQGRYRALIELPVKTMNVNDIKNIYQVDTGPIILPDFVSKKARMVERFHLAFIAYNKADEAYFVIQEPIPAIPAQPDSPKFCHYSRIVRMDAKNCVIALK